MYKRSFPRRRPRKYQRRSRQGAKKGSPGLRRVIRKVIKSQAEHKHMISSLSGNLYVAYGGSGLALNTFNLIPALGQGSNQGARVGDKIKVTSLNFRGFVYLNPAYSSTLNRQYAPVWVKFFIVESKVYKGQNPTFNSNDSTVFFDTGGSDATFSGSMTDLIFPVNTNRFIVHATKMWKLNPSLYNVTEAQPSGSFAAPAQTTGSSAVNQATSQHYFNFNLKNMAKNFQYDQSTSSPSNHNLFCVVQTMYADGTVVTSNLEYPALLTAVVEMKFIDV